jgi:hypothetical protein
MLVVELNALNSVTNMTLVNPAGRTIHPPVDEQGDSIDGFAGYASQADLDRFFPDGLYTLTLNTAHDGSRTFALELTNAAYPNPPTVTNLGAAQAINPSNAFTLSWIAFAGGTTNDRIFLEIENDLGEWVFENNDQGDIPGTATGFSLPANTLAPGRTYSGTLRFAKVVDSELAAYPGVTAAAVYLASTRFTLKTTGQPRPPGLQVLPPTNGWFRARIHGETGRIYTVEGADLLGPSAQWEPVNTQTAWDGTFDFTDFSAPSRPRRFYRVREGN